MFLIVYSTTKMVGYQTARLRSLLSRRFGKLSNQCIATSISRKLLGKFRCGGIYFKTGKYNKLLVKRIQIMINEHNLCIYVSQF